MKQSGLTLIEVLVALIVIAVAFMALAGAQITNLKVTRDSRLASISTQVANATMEQTTQKLFEHDFACGGTTDFPCSGTLNNISVEGRAYSGDYAITLPAGTTYALAGLARVQVTVTTPKPLTFSLFVSCMDTDPPPSLGAPGLCPAA